MGYLYWQLEAGKYWLSVSTESVNFVQLWKYYY